MLPHWRDLAEIVAPLLASPVGASYQLGILLHGATGKSIALKAAAKALGMKQVLIDCLDLSYTSVMELQQCLKELGAEAAKWSPCFLVLRHLHVLSNYLEEAMKTSPLAEILTQTLDTLTHHSPDGAEKCDQSLTEGWSWSRVMVLVGMCEKVQGLASSLRHVFTHEMQIPSLTDDQKCDLLQHDFKEFHLEDAFRNREQCIHTLKEQLVDPSPRDLTLICTQLHLRSQSTPHKFDGRFFEGV